MTDFEKVENHGKRGRFIFLVRYQISVNLGFDKCAYGGENPIQIVYLFKKITLI